MLATLLLFAAPPGGQDNRAVISFMIQMALIFAIIYFMMIRPRMQQEKKHRERLGQLKKGDQVQAVGWRRLRDFVAQTAQDPVRSEEHTLNSSHRT